jgi:hypothetical protein
LERLRDQAKKSVVLHQRRAGTAQIELAPVNDVEALLHVWAAAKKQRKDYSKQVFMRAVLTRTPARYKVIAAVTEATD